MKLKINIKGIVIVIILILGVLFLNNLNTFREGADVTAESVNKLAGEIDQSMDNANVPKSASDTPYTKDLFKQLTVLMDQETAYQTAQANATAEAEKITPLAGNTVAPTLTNNSFFMGNKFSDPFCAMYSGTSKLNEQCSVLSEDSCNLTDCCVYVNGTKCMAGNANGPTDKSNFKNDSDYYLYKYQCYGNCNKPVQSTPQSTPQNMDCSDDSDVISTDCFNEYTAKLKCSILKFPNNVTGKTDTGIIIKNNKFDMSNEREGINWGRMKRKLATAIKNSPQVCNDTNFMTNVFNLKSAQQSTPKITPQSTSQCKPQIIDCSEDLNRISTTCFNEYGAKLNCSSLNIPNNATGATSSSSGFVIANNQLDMSATKEGINWGMMKKAMADGVKKDPQMCSDTNFIQKAFKLKN
jgi:hypothetical protein